MNTYRNTEMNNSENNENSNLSNNDFNKKYNCINIRNYNNNGYIKELLFDISDQYRKICKDKFGTGRKILMNGVYNYYLNNPNIIVYYLIDASRIIITKDISYNLSGFKMMQSGVSYYEGNGYLYINPETDNLDLTLYLNILENIRRLCNMQITTLFSNYDYFVQTIKNLFNLSDDDIETFFDMLEKNISYNPIIKCVEIINKYAELFLGDTVSESVNIIKKRTDLFSIFESYNIIIISLYETILGEMSGFDSEYYNIFYLLLNNLTTLDELDDFIDSFINIFTEYNINIACDILFNKLLAEKFNSFLEQDETVGGAIVKTNPVSYRSPVNYLKRTPVKSLKKKHKSTKTFKTSTLDKLKKTINSNLAKILIGIKISTEFVNNMYYKVNLLTNKTILTKLNNILVKYIKIKEKAQKQFDKENKELNKLSILFKPISSVTKTKKSVMRKKTVTPKTLI
jgi:hypothetical protein